MDIKKLLLVIPVCESDYELAILRASKMKKQEVDILLAFDVSLTQEHGAEVFAAHEKLSDSVTVYLVKDKAQSMNWPFPQNNMFQRVIQHLEWTIFKLNKYIAFYFFEPDVAPLYDDFLSTLWTRFVNGKKLFMGHIAQATTIDGKDLWKYPNGAAFYPLNCITQTPRFSLAQYTPWDVYAGDVIVSQCTDATDIMGLNFGISEMKGSKESWSAKQTLHGANGTTILKEITGSLADHVVVHHGCKDGSIYELIVQKPATISHFLGSAPYPLNKVIQHSVENIADSVKVELPLMVDEQAVNFADPIAETVMDTAWEKAEPIGKEETFEELRSKQLQKRKKRLAKNDKAS